MSQHSRHGQALRSFQPAPRAAAIAHPPVSNLMSPGIRLMPPVGTGAPIAPHAAGVASRVGSPREAEDAELVDLREAARTDGAGISRAESAIRRRDEMAVLLRLVINAG